MNWPILLLLIPMVFMVWVMVVIIRQSPNKETRIGGYLQLSGGLVFLVLHLLRKSDLITWPELVIFMILFMILFSLIVKNRKDAEQMAELRNRLTELEKAHAPFVDNQLNPGHQ